MPINCVDLFCGAGGLTHGLARAGINVVAGLDFDESCRYPFERNNRPARFYAADVAAIDGDMLNDMFPRRGLRLLAGCAPCQPFSSYSLGKTDAKDVRWSLLTEFGRLVGEVQPDLVTMENVPKLERHAVFAAFIIRLKKLGYFVSHKIVNCDDYGVPQRRRRSSSNCTRRMGSGTPANASAIWLQCKAKGIEVTPGRVAGLIRPERIYSRRPTSSWLRSACGRECGRSRPAHRFLTDSKMAAIT